MPLGPVPTVVGTAAVGQIPGTATNDAASAGNIGEYVSSTLLIGSAVSLSNGTAADVTSISLTAGDWDVWGSVFFSPQTTTSITQFFGWTSATSATQPTFPNNGAVFVTSYAAGTVFGTSNNSFNIGMQRITLSSTTTIYLSAKAAFSVSSLNAYGFIGARRVR